MRSMHLRETAILLGRQLTNIRAPLQRYLFMKLTYTDACPNEYEPPFFHSAEHQPDTAYFRSKPFVM